MMIKFNNFNLCIKEKKNIGLEINKSKLIESKMFKIKLKDFYKKN